MSRAKERGAHKSTNKSSFVNMVSPNKDEEKALARSQAEAAFDAAVGVAANYIAVEDFPKLLESIGMAYCAAKRIKMMSCKLIPRKAFVRWYINQFKDVDIDGADDEREEEKAKAEAAFDAAVGVEANYIAPKDFPQLLVSIGMSYSEAREYKRAIKEISDEVITRKAFLHWCMYKDDSDEESDDDSSVVDTEDGSGEEESYDESLNIGAMPELAQEVWGAATDFINENPDHVIFNGCSSLDSSTGFNERRLVLFGMKAKEFSDVIDCK